MAWLEAAARQVGGKSALIEIGAATQPAQSAIPEMLLKHGAKVHEHDVALHERIAQIRHTHGPTEFFPLRQSRIETVHATCAVGAVVDDGLHTFRHRVFPRSFGLFHLVDGDAFGIVTLCAVGIEVGKHIHLTQLRAAHIHHRQIIHQKQSHEGQASDDKHLSGASHLAKPLLWRNRHGRLNTI